MADTSLIAFVLRLTDVRDGCVITADRMCLSASPLYSQCAIEKLRRR